MASIDGGFYCSYDYTLIVGVPRAAVAIYLHYYTRGGGGLTGRIGRKRRNTSAAARRTPSPGAPLDGGFICASADTLFDCISRSVLSIFQFITPKWRGDSAAAPGGGGWGSSTLSGSKRDLSCLVPGHHHQQQQQLHPPLLTAMSSYP
jgi:hypothetical protein